MYNIKPERTITGKIKCKNCGKDIKWHYIIRTKELGVYSGYFPTDTTPASKSEKDNITHYVKCKNCDMKNYFQYIEE